MKLLPDIVFMYILGPVSLNEPRFILVSKNSISRPIDVAIAISLGSVK
jgi:hypothetical protein